MFVVDGYTLTFAALLRAGGALANRNGARAVDVAGLAAFVAMSALCAAAAVLALRSGGSAERL